jgi:2,4-dienoyl-CoA reductase-like NADH-dependent reductase (Old Yellow Enzyme family)
LAELFDPISINGMELRNRFMRSATYDGMAKEGQAAQAQINLYQSLAQGGAGLIVSGLMAVSAGGRLSPFQNCLFDDSCIQGLSRLTLAVHQAGGKVAAQLAHAGRESFLPHHPNNDSGLPAGPSAQEGGPGYEGRCRALSAGEIETIVQDFGRAAGLAKQAGFDAVQLHAAHAYLLAQFLSPLANRREDDWGGPLENRLRVHLEILKAMRKQVGGDYPLMIKLGVADGAPGGLELDQGLDAASQLAQAGFDCLEISQGLRGSTWQEMEFRTKLKPERQNYFAGWAAQVKERIDKPVVMVGGLRDFNAIAKCLDQGQADMAALCRPLIREPGLVRYWQQDASYKPKCISCNQCLMLLRGGRALACTQDDQAARQHIKRLKQKEKDADHE